MARNDLTFELRKKFEVREFVDLFQMTTCMSKYEYLLNEEASRVRIPKPTYYAQNEASLRLNSDSGQEIDAYVVILHLTGPCTCHALLKPDPHKFVKRLIGKFDKNKSNERQFSFDVTKIDPILITCIRIRKLFFKNGVSCPHHQK